MGKASDSDPWKAPWLLALGSQLEEKVPGSNNPNTTEELSFPSPDQFISFDHRMADDLAVSKYLCPFFQNSHPQRDHCQ